MTKIGLRDILLGAIGLMVSVQLFVVNSRLNSLAHRVPDEPSARGMAVGDVLTPVTAINVRQPGQSILAFQSKPTLVFFISPDCKFCTQSLPQFSAIHERVRSRIIVVAISPGPPDDLRRYVDTNRISMDAYTVPTEWLRQSRLRGTPTIILVSSDQHVKRVWIGAPTAAAVEEIISAATAG